MWKSILLLVSVACLGSSQGSFDPRDVACFFEVTALATKVAGGMVNITQQDSSIVLFSGKAPFDLGVKEFCQLVPGMKFMIAEVPIPMIPNMVSPIGFCIYGNCTAKYLTSVEHVVAPIIANLTNNSMIANLNLAFKDEGDTEVMQEERATGFALVKHLIYLLLIICIIGIAVEYTKCMDRPGRQLAGRNVPARIVDRSDKQLLASKTKAGLFFLSFSLTRNIRKMTSVGGGGEGFDPNLEVFAGVRAMSMMYVILGHVSISFILGINFISLQGEMKSTFVTFIQGGFYAVDVFFCMAGFLGTYVLLFKL